MRNVISPFVGAPIVGFLLICACAPLAQCEQRVEVLTDGWRFAPGPQERGAATDLADAGWQTVQIPHDWAISGKPDPQLDAATGKLPWRGEGWYRRKVKISAEDSTRRVYLLFDGVMSEAKVYVNGEEAGGWDYGYNSFWVDATQFIKFGEENVIAVHADTTKHRSRWYPGAGLYRKVSLYVCEAIHAEHWGTHVSSEVSDSGEATISVRSEIRNHLTTPQDISAELVLLGPDEQGAIAGPVTESKTIPAQGAVVVEQEFKLKEFEAWGVESPTLYSVRLRVMQEDRELDQTVTPFGVRKVEFTPKYGLYLNGKRLELRGVNLHHDQGPLGAAFYPRAMQRQLEIMKDMGVNAIRTSHNAPAPELLEMCDRMGLLVIDELFDKWDDTADLHDQKQFEPFMRRNIGNFVRRDRNHPCVIVWSVGNEIGAILGAKDERAKAKVDFVAEQFRQHDNSRPLLMACHMLQVLETQTLDSMDILGWNYRRQYLPSHERFPKMSHIYTESASALSTRGFYKLPLPKNKTDFAYDERQVDSYDHNAAKWADIPDVEFARMQADRFCSGEFVWTGFDYLGEPTPYDHNWDDGKRPAEDQARSSYFGIVDLCGMPKDRYYLYRSHWAPASTTIHILPHWNWSGRDGEPTPVYVYTNGDEAELLLNGKSLGRQKKTEGKPEPDADSDELMGYYRLRWADVPYEPGELTAVAYLKGKEIGSATMRTAGDPEQLRLTPDRKQLAADGLDLCYVQIEVVDAAGVLCPHADATIKISVSGPAEAVGIANGDPTSMNPFVGDSCPLFHGKAMVVLRSKPGSKGVVKVTASSDGLESASASFAVGE
ncbi:Beta-galactosidase [Posidoniimonas polymericola]|uniref:Beta-galactosidase n=1 Tax=Posidoniimonas polymericola TaxID=2528002 RepID=A0A5C5YUZ0_9BACT|nr:glycoside hydrolase family 2 TIM barrel-domain containing protein [Posidoniimonas polymericola]TWT78566.1 Beta-galactosidase [Posidoniimonas polymericola]